MKVMLVIDTLSSGGAQRLFISIAGGLAKKHEVTVFLYQDNSEFYNSDLDEKIPVIAPSRDDGKGFSMSVLKEMIHHAKNQDVVLTFLPTANIYGAMAWLFTPKTRYIANEMSITNENESKKRRFMANVANFMATHVVCNSYTQADYVASKSGMKNRVSTIYNGCRDMTFHPERDVDPKEHSMIVVGRIAYPKNGVGLLRGLQVFYEKHGFIPRVSWAGRDDVDTPRSMDMKDEMLAFLDTHPHLKEQFHFLGEVSDVDALYTRAHSLLSTSIYEGLPVVICEAMLSGCPVVASTVSDNARILGENEERGFLCDPRSPESIAEAIERRVFCSSEALQQKITQARSYAETEFTVSKMVDEYDELITSI